MKRKIEKKLIDWTRRKNRKPLLLFGARQTGKSYILDWLGRTHFDNYVHINLEAMKSIRDMFEGDLNPERIIRFLESATNERIYPEKTLVILDEIQSCERALTSLKIFCEEAPQYVIAAAGSLLGVAINREKYSFPVGKVEEEWLYPLDFEEFLTANGKENLRLDIRRHFDDLSPMGDAEHAMALDLYHQYLIVGGMPAAVKAYIESGSFLSAAIEQQAVLNDYISDMAKYASNSTAVKIRACYNSIPIQLAKGNKKFQYKVVKHGGSSAMFGESIEWLVESGTILKCNKIEHPFMPLAAYVDMSDFKVYMSDIGLLTLRSGIAHQTIMSVDADNTFMGGLTENYVAQALTSNSLPLYYWKNDNTAEVDFVMQQGTEIIPIEVKKGTHTKSISMGNFIKSVKSDYGIRLSQKNFGFANGIMSIPLYAAFCISAG